MSDLERTMAASASGMAAQAARIRLTTENIANVDTPGFRRKTVSFVEVFDGTSDARAVATGPVELDRSELVRVYDPGNPLAGPDGSYLGSNVDLVIEIADAREANRSYEANLKMFDQARQMAGSLIGLLRR
ncbi:MAG TPA: flagellar basal body rod protein FlgC [Amaricoccus sp.]|jgi:flagellar basal-body rod protein FlgC|nr:flagellar basal body rod protein FlgC [Amaricoccus sp.]